MLYHIDEAAFKRLNLQLDDDVFLVEYGYEDFKNRASITRYRKIYHHVLQFVVQGEGQFFINNEIYDLKKNTLFYLPPHTPLKYVKNKDNPYKYFWISFIGKKVPQILQDINISSVNPIVQLEDDTLLDLFTRFSSMDLSAYTLKGLCFMIFGYLNKHFTKQENPEADTKTGTGISHKLKKYISDNFSNPFLTVTDLCKALNLSEIQLYRLSMKTFGMSTKKYLLQCRMEYAEKLLKQGYPISTVFTLSGFSDIYYFSKKFKEKHNVTPSKYKNQRNK